MRGFGNNGSLPPAVIEDLRGRLRFGARLPDGLDPLTLDEPSLRRYALPPRPPAALREARAVWKLALSQPLRLVPLGSVDDIIGRSPLEALLRVFRIERWRPITDQTSNNWSGAAVRPPIAGRCNGVYASWIVPRAEPPPQFWDGGQWKDGTWQGSAWVGLDGLDAGTRTMPQFGTVHAAEVTGGVLTSTAGAWWQWWLKDDPLNAPVGLPLDVQPGDRVIALLTAVQDKVVNFFFKNASTGVAVHFDETAPALPGSPAEPVEGQTAEWTVERQQQIGGEDLLPFANYVTCPFDGCLALAAASDGTPVELDVSDPITMRLVDWTDPDAPGREISTAASTGTFSIRADYVDDR